MCPHRACFSGSRTAGLMCKSILASRAPRSRTEGSTVNNSKRSNGNYRKNNNNLIVVTICYQDGLGFEGSSVGLSWSGLELKLSKASLNSPHDLGSQLGPAQHRSSRTSVCFCRCEHTLHPDHAPAVVIEDPPGPPMGCRLGPRVRVERLLRGSLFPGWALRETSERKSGSRALRRLMLMPLLLASVSLLAIATGTSTRTGTGDRTSTRTRTRSGTTSTPPPPPPRPRQAKTAAAMLH